MDEEALLEELRAGREPAYEELIRLFGARVLAVSRRMLPTEEDALDAMQETFLSAFKALDRFDGRSKLSTWLHRIAVNACLMRRRSRSRRPEESIDELLPEFNARGTMRGSYSSWAEPEAAAERREIRSVVRDSIEQLPETHRNVLLLRDIEGLDTAETAEVLGITPNAVKVRLHRARQALRGLLDPHLARQAG